MEITNDRKITVAKKRDSEAQESVPHDLCGDRQDDTGALRVHGEGGDELGKVGERSRPVQETGDRPVSDSVGGSTEYRDTEQPAERTPLVRKTFFLEESVFAWLEHWAKIHKMRSPSQFLNALLKKIKDEDPPD
jgi:hypothetical protein